MRDRLSPTFSLLVIHNRKPFRAGVRLMIESLGHQVFEAVDAPTGLAVIDQHDVEVVLLDTDSPGLANLMAIRMDSNIPIVAVTRRGLPIVVCCPDGRLRIIHAPLGLEELVDTLAQAVAFGRASVAGKSPQF
jgi:CheY-like chemotaxis protein